MIIFHGSDTIIDNPKIIMPNRPLDFGGGFYLTTNYEQAIKWAKRVSYRNQSNQMCINKYEFDYLSAKNDLVILEFTEANEKWLDFICKNRQGIISNQYDIVIGPVADDKVYKVVVEYENQIIDKETALKNLKTEQLCNQLLFHTEKSLTFLKYNSTEVIDVHG